MTRSTRADARGQITRRWPCAQVPTQASATWMVCSSQARRGVFHSRGRSALGFGRPRLARGRGLGGSPWCQGGSRFKEHGSKCLGLCRQTGLAQQCARSQPIQTGIKPQIMAAGDKSSQRFAPCAGGLKTGAESVRLVPSPELARLPQQLRVGQQNQRAGRMRRAGLQRGHDAGKHALNRVIP
jgi:hypothetical protein